jgi:ABC-type transport system involved in cytochrome bd biosynthesis fused ATPase/permease subunit
MAAIEDATVIAPARQGSVEEAIRSHYGLMQIVQTVIGSLLLMLASLVYFSIRDYGKAISDQATDIAVIKAQMRTVSDSVAQNQSRVDAQIVTLTNISSEIIRLSTKQGEDERQIQEIKQTKPLK